jgi:uncharacterized protein
MHLKVSDALSTLCLACGMCCDGTLFDSVPLTPSDPELPGLVVVPTGARRLPQRCPNLSQTTCTAYGLRPTACRGFVCLLGQALKEGEVGLSEALRLVGQAHRLLREVQQAFGFSDPERVVALARHAPAPTEAQQAILAAAVQFLRLRFHRVF